MKYNLLFDTCGEIAAELSAAVLSRHGYRVVRSFDLRSATSAHADCECPYHGAARCTCQFAVLLVYGETGDPVVVTAHSRDAQAHVQIVQDGAQALDLRLVRQVMAALAEAAQAVRIVPVEAVKADAV